MKKLFAIAGIVGLLTMNAGSVLAAITIDSLAIDTQVGSLTYGTGASVTYQITVNSTGDSGSTDSCTLGVSGLPSGISSSFSVGTLNFTETDSDTSVLTLTTDSTAQATASSSFTVTCGPVSNAGSVAIAQKAITASVSATNKTYDGNTAATTNCTPNDLVGSDVVTCSAAAATFDTADVGTVKTVSATGITLGGANASNYSLSSNSANTTADITQATLTYTADAKNRVYAQADPIFTGTVTGFFGSDNESNSTTGTLTFSTTATTSSNVGSYAINGSGLTVTNPNYSSTIAQAAGNATAFTITKETATINLTNTTHVFNGTAKTVTAATTPASLTVGITYNGGAAPSAVGSYAVVATINETNYQGTQNGTMDITNNAPTANATSTSTLEDTAKVITLSGDDGESVPTQTLTYAIGTGPTNGTLGPVVGNTVNYTPNANFNGSDSFTFTVNDGAAVSAPATVSITVTAVNDAPSFTKGADQSVPQDSGAQTVTNWVTATSTGPADETGDSLSYVVSNDNNALFSVQPAVSAVGTLTFTSAPAATGTAVVSIQVQDNGGTANGGSDTSAVQTFNISITKVNVAPVVNATSTTTLEDNAKVIVLTGTDGNGDTINYSIVSGPTNGTLGAVSGNQVTYTPNANWNGIDSFVFQGTDVDSAFSTSTATITVTSVNDTPSFSVGASQLVAEDAGAQTVSTFATALSTGPSDENGQALDFIVSNDNNALFSVQPAISATGELTYTPATNANGSAVVSVQIHDNGGTANGGSDTSGIQTFSITVSAVNDAPVLGTISDQTQDELSTITFTASATDVDVPTTLSYSLTGAPAAASINSSTGAFSWTTTETDGPGTYTFDVVVSDGQGGVDSQTITLTINEVNVAPVTSDVSVTTNEDTTATTTLSATDVDVPVQTLTLSIVSQPANGTVTLVGNDAVFTPNANWFGTTTYQYAAFDGVATGTPSTVTVTVTSVNDVPVITLLGSTPLLLSNNYQGFVDPMATAIDVEDGDISANVIASGPVDTSVVTSYVLTYTITDSDSASASVNRDVTIVPQLGGAGGGSGEVGCRDPRATNYSATARYDGITCTYAPQGEVLGAASSTQPAMGTTTPNIIVTVVASNPGMVLGEMKFNFVRNLRMGMRGEDVTELQKLLIAEGFLKISNPTQYFGALTQAALIKWQLKNNLPGTGFFGALSRGLLNN